MSRPTKCRRVCHFPPSPGFFPIQKGEADTPVILTVDEYETIRLMDLEAVPAGVQPVDGGRQNYRSEDL